MRIKKKFDLYFSVMTLFFVLIALISNEKVVAATTLTWPVPGHFETSGGFYYYSDENCHAGLDILGTGADIVSACNGTVYKIYKCSTELEKSRGIDHSQTSSCHGFGTGMVIRGDDNRSYVYGHMQANSIPSGIVEGTRVSAGQKIGVVGQTGFCDGPHLHFQINNDPYDYWTKSKAVDPSKESYAGVNKNPVGCVDYCQNKDDKLWIAGWAYDPDEPSKSLAIHVYANDQFIKAITASEESPDVNSAYGISGKHRFDATIDLPNGNYTVRIYAIDSQGGGNPYLGSHPNQNDSYNITINKSTYRITTASVNNGTVKLSKTSAKEGEEITVTTTPASGYTLDKITVNGTTISGNKFTMPAKDTTVAVTFKKLYTITVVNTSHASVSFSKNPACEGDEITVTVTPDTGYLYGTIKVNGTAISGKTFTMPAQDTTVEVKISKKSYSIELSDVINGTASLSTKTLGQNGKPSATIGTKITVTATPDNGYTLDVIKVNGVAIDGNEFTMPPQNSTVEVIFKKLPSYSVSLGALTNGTASLSKTTANAGDEITVTATPASGYELDKITVNGTAISGNKFTMPAEDTVVVVTFKEKVHTLTKIPAKAATCTEEGNITYYICKDTDCGCKKLYSDAAGQNEISLVDTVVPATGHSFEKVAAKQATCTEDGHLAYWKCSKCGKMFADADGKTEISAANVLVEATGHDTEHVKHVGEKAPTYKEDGHKEYYECPECGKKFADPDCKNPVTDAELLIQKKGAAVLGEEATVGDFNYRVTYQATDGTGTVTLISVDNKTASVVIPSSVEIKGNIYKVNRIGTKAFYGDKIVKTVYIGNNVVIIDSYAFYGCSNLVKVSGGKVLKTIGSKAFAYCSKLKSFSISSSVLNKIGSYAFQKDKKLKTVYIKYTTKLTKSGVKKSLKSSSVKTVKVKKSKVKKYKKYFTKKNAGRKVKVKK